MIVNRSAMKIESSGNFIDIVGKAVALQPSGVFSRRPPVLHREQTIDTPFVFSVHAFNRVDKEFYLKTYRKIGQFWKLSDIFPSRIPLHYFASTSGIESIPDPIDDDIPLLNPLSDGSYRPQRSLDDPWDDTMPPTEDPPIEGYSDNPTPPRPRVRQWGMFRTPPMMLLHYLLQYALWVFAAPAWFPFLQAFCRLVLIVYTKSLYDIFIRKTWSISTKFYIAWCNYVASGAAYEDGVRAGISHFERPYSSVEQPAHHDILKFLNIPPEHDVFFTALACLAVSFHDSKTNAGRLSACMSFLVSTQQVGGLQVVNYSANILRALTFCLTHDDTLSATLGFTDVADAIEKLLDNFSQLEESASYVAIIRLVSMLSTLSMFGDSSSKLFLEKHNIFDPVVTSNAKMLRTDKLIIESVRCVSALLRSMDTVPTDRSAFVYSPATLEENIYLLSSNVNNISVSGYNTKGMPLAEFLSRLQACDKYIKRFYRENKSPWALKTIERPSSQVAYLCKQFNTLPAESGRPLPFNIALTGIPGTGKTDIAVRTALAGLEKLGYVGASRTNIFFKNSTMWWDGYDPIIHWAVIIDEISGLKGQNGERENIKNFVNILAITSESPLLTEQAEAHNKANVPLTAAVIVLISNIENFAAPTMLAEPRAFFRRMNVYLHCADVYPQFATPVGAIDPSKVPEGTIDLVNIQVKLYEQSTLSALHGPSHVPYTYSLTQILALVARKASIHKKVLDAAKTRAKAMHAIPCIAHNELYCSDCSQSISADANAALDATAGISMTRRRLHYHLNSCYIFTYSCTSYVWWYMISLGFSIMVGAVSLLIKDQMSTQWCVATAVGRHYMNGHLLSAYENMGSAFVDTVDYAREMRVVALGRTVDLRKYRIMLAIFTAAAAAGTIYLRMQRAIPDVIAEPTGNNQSKKKRFDYSELGVDSVPITGNHNNIWVKPEVYVPFGKSCCNPRGLQDKIVESTYRISTGSTYSHIFFVKGNYGIIAGHFDISGPVTIKRYQLDPSGGYVTVQVWEGKIPYSTPCSLDVKMVLIPGFRPHLDLTEFFLRGYPSPTLGLDVWSPFVARSSDVGEEGGLAFRIMLDKGVADLRHCVSTAAAGECWNMNGIVNSYSGRCGTILVADIGKSACILGINIMGSVGIPRNVYSAVFTTHLELAFDALAEQCTGEYCPPLSATSVSKTVRFMGEMLEDPKRMHHLHYAPENAITYHGVISGSGSTLTSSVVILPIVSEVNDLMGTTIDPCVPIFSHTKIDGEYFAQEKHAIRDLSGAAKGVDLKLAIAAENLLFDRLKVVAEPLSLHMLSAHDALNGIPGTALSRMKLGTSVGWPYNGLKSDYVRFIPKPDNVHNIELGRELEDELEYMCDQYTNMGARSNCIFKASFKDEPLSREKVIERKVRMFSAGGTALLVLCRQIFGPILMLASKHPSLFETIAGVNCFSRDWESVFFDTISQPNVVNSDFKRYDKSIPAFVSEIAYTLMIRLCAYWYRDWDVNTELIARGLMSEIAHPLYLLDGTVLEVNGSNPSGSYLTLFQNGLCQSIMHRMNYLRLVPEYVGSFEENVSVMTLGDDGSQGISDEAIEFYNMRTMASSFADIGMVITSADKGVESVESEGREAATIGKRSYYRDPESGLLFCPLEKASISKMLCTTSTGGFMTAEERSALSFEAAICEMAMYGREEYSRVVPQILSIAEKMGINNLMSHVLSYDDILDRFKKGGLAPQNMGDDTKSPGLG
jgi:hypothetical protein